MKTKSKKILFAILACVLLMTVLSVSVFATGAAGGSGDVAGAIQGTWDTAKTQIKSVVNNVILAPRKILCKQTPNQTWPARQA